MSDRLIFQMVCLLLGIVLLAGCDGSAGGNLQATVDAAVAATAAAQAQIQVTIDAAVVATQAAQARTTDVATALTPTPVPPPTAVVIPLSTPTEQPAINVTPTNPAPSCEVVSAGLNLRAGPGLAFEPPLRALSRGTVITPLAFVGRGFPSGQWIEVQVNATGQRGWVSAGAQFVACNVDVTVLPPGVVPPTPTPLPPTVTPTVAVTAQPPPATPTRIQFLAVLPVDGGGGDVLNIRNNRDVKGGRNILLPGFEPSEVSEPMVFRDRIVFQVEVSDKNVGTTDGAGIATVTFFITDPYGATVHQRTEYNAGYCVFGGGEPDCVVWRFSEHDGRWPGGALVRDGLHNVEVVIQPKTGEPVKWFWSFQIARP